MFIVKVLHICNDFSGSKVHANLYKSLESLGVSQVVYTYFINPKYIGRNFFQSEYTKIIYANVLTKYDRYFFYYKGWKLFCDLKKHVNPCDIDICHATTLFSDGSVAYRLYKKYHIPYIVTIRNTDINLHLRNASYRWPYAKRILLNAAMIIFISEASKNKFCNHSYIQKFLLCLKDKMIVIPNGIDDYWLNCPALNRQKPANNHKVVYVGVFDENKNIFRLAEAVMSLRKKYPDIHLTLVGGRGALKEQVKEMACHNPDVIDYCGLITDKEVLRNIYLQHSIFAMPSFHETLGLVYIEAISQGLACIYTKGQGIDGMFPSETGIGVNPGSVSEIANAIDLIFQNRSKFSNSSIDLDAFRWSRISQIYYNMYMSILGDC